jgi:hypothetical protein
MNLWDIRSWSKICPAKSEGLVGMLNFSLILRSQGTVVINDLNFSLILSISLAVKSLSFLIHCIFCQVVKQSTLGRLIVR